MMFDEINKMMIDVRLSPDSRLHLKQSPEIQWQKGRKNQDGP
jgi:hypothetical protein